MDIILIPGFWLDASSWSAVTPPLVAAGHRVHPLTLPGLESVDADRSGITLRDHIDAVVALIDTFDEPVVLVGHSGGGAIAHGAVDARPDSVARVVYVDSGPLADGGVINDELPVVDGEIPLPEWSIFPDEDLVDLTDELRAELRAASIPQPARVASDAQALSDERRFDVPVTVIACEFPSSLLTEWMAGGHPYVAELARISDVELLDLPTGHWPQFTRPAELGDLILSIVSRD
ncbi:alpha/beta fold hydrolase [Agromyces atrinae]|uniref:Alpha/beta hydrolase n=1 Tax=Agromyces atrinae TaxID=592376 RepID=A0A4Q2M163_9MICO|nr:alpha/beta hydrolase [Agromyces atrinae]NYD68336.1 pimeloyl-ACP methyl ester carboxylesterase [Agromyces atrinae]RXZ85614.1 alpha/beta hydrolase [Agromyces atrinae]